MMINGNTVVTMTESILDDEHVASVVTVATAELLLTHEHMQGRSLLT